jgi:hypothetical protein
MRKSAKNSKPFTLKRMMLAAVIPASGLSGSLINAGVAGAGGDPTCPHGGELVSLACFYGVLQYGDYSSWNNLSENMSSGDIANGHHITNTLWSYSGSPCTSWMEIGYTHGYHGNAGYFYYGAVQPTNNFYYDFSIGPANPNGSHHTYEVLYTPTSWQMLLDGSTKEYSYGELGAGACKGATGLETSVIDSSTSTGGSFAHTPLKWQDSGGSWHLNWNTSQYWVDQPCGVGGRTTLCLNGAFPNANEWDTNAVG